MEEDFVNLILPDYYELISDRGNFEDETSYYVKNIKGMLELVDKEYENVTEYKDLPDIKKFRKAVCISLLFDYMSSNNEKVFLIYERPPRGYKFREVLKQKLDEFKEENMFNRISRWKGCNYYANKLQIH